MTIPLNCDRTSNPIAENADFFDIESGSLVLVCGMTGSGKSSFLRLLQSDALVGYLTQEPPTNPDNRSYGERRLTQIKDLLAQNPDVLLLDEPTTGLDPVVSTSLARALVEKNKHEGITMIIAESNISEFIDSCDRIIFLVDRKIVFDGNAQDFVLAVGSKGSPYLSSLPICVQVAMIRSAKISTEAGHDAAAGLYLNAPYPLSIESARNWLKKTRASRSRAGISEDNDDTSAIAIESGHKLIEMKDISVNNKENQTTILNNINMSINSGQVLALIGANGSGKSVLLSLIAGTLENFEGDILRQTGNNVARWQPRNNVAMLAQDLQSATESDQECLSVGERRRRAIDTTFEQQAEILLLDEPTKGLDAKSKNTLITTIKKQRESGKAVVIASQDMNFIAECADYCALILDGKVQPVINARNFLMSNELFTTDVVKITRGIIKDCVVIEDIFPLL